MNRKLFNLFSLILAQTLLLSAGGMPAAAHESALPRPKETLASPPVPSDVRVDDSSAPVTVSSGSPAPVANWPLTVAANAIAIAAGAYHACALTSSGGVKCWGRNDRGQLGDGTTTERHTPVDVSGLTSGVTAIAAGAYHTCAVAGSGGVKCWGENDYGQLGDGTITERHMPVVVSGLTSGVTAIAAGDWHVCAVTSGGGIKCWGDNYFGQLGDGTTTERHMPVDVSGLTSGVTAIAAGGRHTSALTNSGGVKCWGLNYYGQLGDGTTTDRHAPVDVSGLTSGVRVIATGYWHTCAVTGSGGVKCWGYNSDGQLGDGTKTNRLTPMDVSGLTSGVTAIVAGAYHTCAVSGSGGGKCWGYNAYGQLGDGTTTERRTPVDVSGLMSGVTAIEVGYRHTCAMTGSGGVKCWGDNYYGQLGDGTTTGRYTPVDVSGFGGGPTYTISGRVADNVGSPVSGVTVSAGAGYTAITDGSGNYTISGLAAGSYTVTPSKTSYTFSPPSRTVSVPPSASGQNFTTSSPPQVTIIMPSPGSTVYQGGSLLVKATVTLGGQPAIGSQVKSQILLGGPYKMSFGLFDDGQHEDGAADDGIYAERIGLYGSLTMPTTGNPYSLIVTATSGGSSGSASSSINVSPSQGAPQVSLQISGPHSPEYYAGDRITLTGMVTYPDSSTHTDTTVSVSIMKPDLSVNLASLYNVTANTWTGTYVLPAGVGGSFLFDLHAAPPPGSSFVDSWGGEILTVYKSALSLIVTNPPGTLYIDMSVPLKVCAVANGQPVSDAVATATVMPENSSVNLNSDSNGCYLGSFIPSQSGAHTVTFTAAGHGYRPGSASGSFTVSSASTDLGQAITSFTGDYKSYSTDVMGVATRVSTAGDWFSRQLAKDEINLFTTFTFDFLTSVVKFDATAKNVVPGVPGLRDESKQAFAKVISMLIPEKETDFVIRWLSVLVDTSAPLFYAKGGDLDSTVNQPVREFVASKYEEKLKDQTTGLQKSFLDILDQKTLILQSTIDDQANQVIGSLPSLNLDPALRVSYIHDLALRSRANYWMGLEEYRYSSDLLIYKREVSQWQNSQKEKYRWLKWVSETALRFGILFSPLKVRGYQITDKAIKALNYYFTWKDIEDDQRFRDLAVGLMEQAHGTQLFLVANAFSGLELVSEKIAPTTPAGEILSVDLVRTQTSGWRGPFTRDVYADIQVQNTGANSAEYGVMIYYYSNKPGPFEVQRVLEEMRDPSNDNVLPPAILSSNQTKTIRVYFRKANGDDAGIPVAPLNQFTIALYAITDQGVYIVDTSYQDFSPRAVTVSSFPLLSLSSGNPEAEVRDSQPLSLASSSDTIADYPISGRVGSVANSTRKAFHIIVQNPFPQPLAAKVSQSVPASVSIVDTGSGTISGGQIAWFLNLDPHQTVYLDYEFNYTGGFGVYATLPPVALDFYSAADNVNVSFNTGDILFYSDSPLAAQATANMAVAPGTQQAASVTVTNLDSAASQQADLTLDILDQGGNKVRQRSVHVAIPAGASQAYNLDYVAPAEGYYMLNVSLQYGGENTILLYGLLNVRVNRVYLPLVLRNYTSSTTNHSPNTPSAPSPASRATNQAANVILSWTGGDPDGDAVIYDVYVEAGDSTPDVLLCNDVASASCNPGTLSYSTHYYWQVIARDEHGATATGPVWEFTTSAAPNNPPHTPSNPSPANSATSQPITVTLSWTGGDPDGDAVTYDVYFAANDSTPDVLLCNDVTNASCNPGTLSYGTHYYWQVVTWDEHGATATGPMWNFVTLGADNLRYIARWDGSSWNSLGSGLNNYVYAIAAGGPKVYVGGGFTDAGGNPNADYIARWDTGDLAPGWDALGSGLDNTVHAIAVEEPNVYVGGSFTNAGGNPSADYVARWDGTSWNALGSGLNHLVSAIAVVGANVYVGGFFTDAGGNADADRVARWDGSSWNSLGNGLNNYVYAIAAGGPNVYVGGEFTDAGGNPNADYIARWDGFSWESIGGGLNGVVRAIAVEGSNVYAGGEFTDAGGNPSADYIARWDGVSWNALGSGLNHYVYAIAVEEPNVYVGGSFTNAGGNPNADYVARWDGASWNALGSGLNHPVSAIAVAGANVYVGGFFTDAGGNANANFSAWNPISFPITNIRHVGLVSQYALYAFIPCTGCPFVGR